MTTFLIILLVILLLLLIPVKLFIGVDNAVSLTIGWLFLKLPLVGAVADAKHAVKPPKPKKAKKPSSKAEKDKPPKVKEPFNAQKLKDILSLSLNLAKRCTPVLRRLLKRTVVASLDLKITVAEGDAAKTALSCGRYSAILHTAIAAIGSVFTLKLKNIEINPDFEKDSTSFALNVTIKLIPLALLTAGLNLLVVSGAELLKWMNKTKKAKNNPSAGKKPTGNEAG